VLNKVEDRAFLQACLLFIDSPYNVTVYNIKFKV